MMVALPLVAAWFGLSAVTGLLLRSLLSYSAGDGTTRCPRKKHEGVRWNSSQPSSATCSSRARHSTI
jgi:hypothetical protein